MAIQEIARERWHRFLEHLTRRIRSREGPVEIAVELDGLHLARSVPLLGLSYDEAGDLLEVDLDRIGHRVLRPTGLSIDHLAGGVTAIEIVGSDGVRTLLRLKEPLLLPEPACA